MTFEKPKSKLFTPDPYYIPGYCGYCPMQKYQLGETYGKTTAKILTDGTVAKSDQSVLREKVVQSGEEDAAGGSRSQSSNSSLQSLRNSSWGDRKLNSKMIPGYTGYIPKSEHYYGSRYAHVCKTAVNDIIKHNETRQMSKQIQQERRLPALIPVRRDGEVYISPHQAQHSVSPYFMTSDSEGLKTFISGYTGFIPRARSRFSKGYPVNTRNALIDFTNNQQKIKAVAQQDVQLIRQATKAKRNQETKTIYNSKGLLPHYTGYLPAHKFRYALTYGNSSRACHIVGINEAQ